MLLTTRPSSSPSPPPCSESGDSPSELQVDQISEAHLLLLEDAIRDEVRMKRSIHETSKDMLMKMFK